MALHFECRFNKKSILQNCFLVVTVPCVHQLFITATTNKLSSTVLVHHSSSQKQDHHHYTITQHRDKEDSFVFLNSNRKWPVEINVFRYKTSRFSSSFPGQFRDWCPLKGRLSINITFLFVLLLIRSEKDVKKNSFREALSSLRGLYLGCKDS